MTYLPVKQNGLIDVAQLEAAIRPDTALVSVMAVNNEIGVIQPLKVVYRASCYIMCTYMCEVTLHVSLEARLHNKLV